MPELAELSLDPPDSEDGVSGSQHENALTYWENVLARPTSSSRAAAPPRTIRPASLTRLNAVGVLQVAKSSPYQLLSGEIYPLRIRVV